MRGVAHPLPPPGREDSEWEGGQLGTALLQQARVDRGPRRRRGRGRPRGLELPPVVKGTQRDETEVCIALYDDPKSKLPTLLTPSGSTRYSFNEPDAKFLEDILILSFVRGDEKLDQLNAQFLQVDSMKCLNEVDPGSIIHFLTIAFPSIGNHPKLTGDGMGYDEFGTGFVRLALELHDIPTLEKHISFRVMEEPRKERELDGFSGAPVYFLFVDHGEQVHVGWAGIIRLAGNGIIHAYMASEIRQYIRSSRMA